MLSLGTRLGIGSPRYAPRRAIALFASLVVLFQALVFAWHRHELLFASRGLPALTAPTGSETPAAADHDCPICFAIAHHGGVPVELFAAPPPDGRALQPILPATIDDFRAPYLLFRPRAPPSGLKSALLN